MMLELKLLSELGLSVVN